MARTEARKSHATVRVFRREGQYEHDLWRDHLPVIAADWHCLRRGSPCGVADGEDGVGAGIWLRSILRPGTGDRVFCKTELGAGHGEPDLPALVVLFGLVGSCAVSAKDVTALRDVLTAVSPEPVSAERGRHRARWVAMVACTGADRSDSAVPGNCADRVFTRSGKALRMSLEG